MRSAAIGILGTNQLGMCLPLAQEYA